VQPARTISYEKTNGQRFIFRCEAGSEALLLDALIALVHRGDVSFDWFDAGVISHQLGRQTAGNLPGAIHVPKPDDPFPA
jgi:hypothetical protein